MFVHTTLPQERVWVDAYNCSESWSLFKIVIVYKRAVAVSITLKTG